MLNKQKGNRYNWKLPNIENMQHLYFEDKLSIRDIAKKYHVGLLVMSNFAKDYPKNGLSQTREDLVHLCIEKHIV